MKLFVGLGNPGAQYAGNRHNIGFMALDRIAEDHGFTPWRARFQGLVAEGRLGVEKVVALKPQTFMNLSGQSVGEAMRFWKIAPEDVVVFHDELDLPPFRVRLKTGGGHAGHNGLRSIAEHGGAAAQRVRLGIGHPGEKSRVTGHVLGDFAKAERADLEALLDAIAKAAPDLAAGQGARFIAALPGHEKAPKKPKPEKAAHPAAEATPEAKPDAPPQPDAPAQPDAKPEPEALSPLARLAAHFSKTGRE
ncbi:aminoacyl-tRNA hydrolase [Phaeovulum vinaykumarii]|uniref:Peptidyl-tRNA hydrolase n=1 Tax=Phaeovulum vinaykumarii TaxID=407234 RepID=A0A1N7JM41_9RHOB|nr:aminoacyl-tRNA hydrolase [Phaeovulum vinaykumarii]SIS50375.1 peptidyl-tRNA hydrolase [Phaeovulum vinaykumarii]SOB90236.1 peptidyl-tRNA hydrolase [Phaeovulum vinaykumarii]